MVGGTRRTFFYPVISCRVYDGDTIMDIVLDLGFHLRLTITGRLHGINAPEVRGHDRVAGVAARDYLAGRIERANVVHIETVRSGSRMTGKYGRWLIRVWADGVNLNDALVSEGHAVRKHY
jgi:endonuclease YncB( thermonuclease family)